MNVELPQILTHIVGFLIAFWVLKRFAFGPLLKMLEDRREKIRADFDEADKAKSTAEQLAADYEERIKNIEAEARQKIQEAITEGRRVSAEIKEQAHAEARGIIEKAKGDLIRDIATARVQLKQDIVAMTLDATRKILNESLDDQRHRRLIGEFIDQVETAK
jgi:F-type H+-transporting ATPase subunit b